MSSLQRARACAATLGLASLFWLSPRTLWAQPGGATTSLSMNVAAAADSNARLEPDAAAFPWSSSLGLGLLHTRQLGKLGLSLDGNSGYSYNPREPDLSRPNYAGSLKASWAPTRRSSFTLSQGVASSFTRENRELVESGLILPQTGVLRASTAASFTQGFSNRAQLSVSSSYGWAIFDKTALRDAPPLVDGSQLSLQSMAGYRLSTRYAIEAGYGFGQRMSRERQSRSHALGIGGSWQHERGHQVSASAGAAFLERVRGFRALGSLKAASRRGRTTLQASYNRTITEAYGLGRDRLADSFALSIARPLSPSVNLAATAGYGTSSDPEDREFTTSSLAIRASLAWKITQSLAFSAVYSHLRSAGNAPQLQGTRASHSVSASLGYSFRLD
jgi:hypothetical protein